MRARNGLFLAVCVSVFFMSCGGKDSTGDEIELVARWIRSSAVVSEDSTTWPAVPGDDKTINNTLYSGTPGVVLFFLEAFYATGKEDYLEDAQAEHRSRPDFLQAQKNLMQGAAGIGLWLLHREEQEKGQPLRIVMPDNPFR